VDFTKKENYNIRWRKSELKKKERKEKGEKTE